MGNLAVPEIPVIRQVTAPLVLRADAQDPGNLGLLDVRFSAFDVWYRIESFWEGEFMERTAKGAFKQTIREDLTAMRSLFDHGFDPQIGNKVLGPIRSLTEETDSPLGVVPLFDTTYNRDLLPGLRAGVYGSSFRMRVREEKWNDEPDPSDYNPKGIPERTITNVRLFEFGPVTFPANPEATASMRSATDHYMELLHDRDSRAFEDAVRSVQRIRPGFTGDLSTRAVPGPGSRRLSPRVARAIGGTDAAALQALLSRLAVADAAYDPICDALCAADEALDDALVTVADLLGVANPDPMDGEDMAETMPGRSTTDFTGDPATWSGGRGERMERGSTTPTAATATGDNQATATADLVLRQRHLLLREKGIVTK